MKCKTNEKYSNCGSACPSSCDDPFPACTFNCTEGCFCIEGTIRNEFGKCVPEAECPCPANETYTNCGSACPGTCDIPEPKVCTDICISGCFCNVGFVRDVNTKQCVPIEECTCSNKNEVFRICGPDCEPTCNKPNPNCDGFCRPGCYCQLGYIREKESGQCIKTEQCPCTDPYKVYSDCGTPCPARCQFSARETLLCSHHCVTGCFCTNGTILDGMNNKCVFPEQCGCKKSNEIYDPCGPTCQDTCVNPTPKKCDKNCRKTCSCINGTIRDESTGECVQPDKCKCPPKEIFATNACEKTCSNPFVNQYCTGILKSGCYCRKNFVRNEQTGFCVPRQKCCDASNNEVYDLCVTPCERTCASPFEQPNCEAPCRPGCKCKKGFLKNSAGVCVPKNRCN